MSKKIGYKARHRKYQDKYNRKFSQIWFLYCQDVLENIEGWDKMLNDTSGQRWELHHRDEIPRDDVVVSKEELINRGEYFNLPANKLIFMTESEHRSMHSSIRTGELHPMCGRTGEKNPTSKPIEIDGVIYCSKRAAVKALEKCSTTIYNWLKRGKARYI